MSIKQLLPLAGLVALIGCAGATGPNCLVNESQGIGVDSVGAAITVEAKVPTPECQDLQEEF
jgi:hypothetical protein